jgi:ribonuclease R
MIQFSTQLIKGIYRKDVPKTYQDLVEYLISKKILKGGKVLTLSNDYLIGKIDINSKGVGFITPHTGKKDLLIEKRNLGGANKGDLVIAKKLYNKGSRPKAKVILLLQKNFEFIVGYLSFKPNPVVKNIKTDKEIQVFVKEKQLKKLPENTVFKLNNYTNEIVEILGNLNDPTIDEKFSLTLYNREDKFPHQAIIEAQSFGDYVDKSLYMREDLTELQFCTIDPENSKDHDDAIYFDTKTNTLYVAIADVSEYVYPNGAIDKEAQKRGFSIYFPHKAIPMLPYELSENICSLKENEDRLAMVFKIKFDKNHNVIDETLTEAIICSKRKYSYKIIDSFLEGKGGRDEIDTQILEWLLPLFNITKHLKKERLKTGLDFVTDEIIMSLDKNGNLEKVKFETETDAHALIEDCMLLANKAAAKMIQFGIFRVHQAPKTRDIKNLLVSLIPFGIEVEYKNNPIETFKTIQHQAQQLNLKKMVDTLIIKTQQQAKYESYHHPHFALGFKKYTHFTSPIRRYSDLTLHRLLKSIIHQNQKLHQFILRNIESLVVKISELEREVVKIEWDFYDRKFARWANQNIGKVVKGVIIDSNPPPIAKIDDIIVGARVFLNPTKVRLFEKVDIQIVSVNLATTKIYGEIVK